MIKERSAVNTQQEGINIKDFALRLVKNWYWFLASAILGVGISLVLSKYSAPKYEVSNVVLIKADSKDESLSSLFNEQRTTNYKATSITNQVGIIKSYRLNLKAIQNLNWDISIYEKGFLSLTDLYLAEPFIVEKIPNGNLLMTPVYITPISNEVLRVTVDEIFLGGEKRTIDLTKEVHFDEPFTNEYFHFTVKKIEGVPLQTGKTYMVIFNDLNALAHGYKERLNVAPGDEDSDLIYIKLESTQPTRDVNYLNELANVYIEFGLEEKNKVADNTLKFINNQLIGITDSLQIASKHFTNFRSKNKIVNLGQEASMVVENFEQIEREEAASRMKLEYYTNLKKYLNDAKQMRDLVAPSVVGITDNALNSLVLKLSDLYSQRELLSYSAQEKNPNLVSLDNTIQYTQKILRENIENLLTNTDGEIKSMEQRKQRINGMLTNLPKTEQDLVNIKRSFDLNNELYTFLLRKRAEIGIARASNSPEATVLDTARFDAVVRLGPSKKQIILIGLLLGLGIPFGVFLLLDYFDKKIKHIDEVERQSDLPVAGSVFTNRFKTDIPVFVNPNSAVTESFRSLRANVYHILDHSDKKIIAIHSSLVGEGKSFVSANLGVSLAINNKKVLLVETDMRKPRLYSLFKLNRENGLSTYLNGKMSFQQVVQHTKIPGLNLVASGAETTHPSELLNSDLFQKFLKEARNLYDYIVLDSVPIGVLSDAACIGGSADLNLIIVRMNHSSLAQIKAINKLAHEGVMKNMALVLNDVSDEITKKQLRNYGYE